MDARIQAKSVRCCDGRERRAKGRFASSSLVEDTMKPGFHLGRHHHKKMTEIFYILEGELTLIFDVVR